MSISEKDVLHVASLARLVIEPERLPALVSELNGIIEHMEVLGAIGTEGQLAGGEGGTTSTPMRSDTDGAPIPLALRRDEFAPEMRDGFFLVPRLATHEDQGDRTP